MSRLCGVNIVTDSEVFRRRRLALADRRRRNFSPFFPSPARSDFSAASGFGDEKFFSRSFWLSMSLQIFPSSFVVLLLLGSVLRVTRRATKTLHAN